MPPDPANWPVTTEDRSILVTWSRSTAVSAGRALRARIVLAAAEGDGTGQIAERLGVTRPTVIKWRSRYAAAGLAGLDDRPRPGHPRIVGDEDVLVATLAPPPPGATRWSTRLLAKELGIGDATVARAWRRCGIQPVDRTALSLATTPALEAASVEVLGVHLNGSDRAVVVRVRPPVISATPQGEPMRKGSWGTASPSREQGPRHGSRRLVAAMARAIAGDGPADTEHPGGLLGFLTQIHRTGPPTGPHVLLDVGPAGEPPGVRDWIEAHGWAAPHIPIRPGGWPRLLESLVALTVRDTDAQGVTEAVGGVQSLVAITSRDRLSFTWLAG